MILSFRNHDVQTLSLKPLNGEPRDMKLRPKGRNLIFDQAANCGLFLSSAAKLNGPSVFYHSALFWGFTLGSSFFRQYKIWRLAALTLPKLCGGYIPLVLKNGARGTLTVQEAYSKLRN